MIRSIQECLHNEQQRLDNRVLLDSLFSSFPYHSRWLRVVERKLVSLKSPQKWSLGRALTSMYSIGSGVSWRGV